MSAHRFADTCWAAYVGFLLYGRSLFSTGLYALICCSVLGFAHWFVVMGSHVRAGLCVHGFVIERSLAELVCVVELLSSAGWLLQFSFFVWSKKEEKMKACFLVKYRPGQNQPPNSEGPAGATSGAGKVVQCLNNPWPLC